jgi:hypothetical protein
MEWRDSLATTLEVDSYHHGGDTLMDDGWIREPRDEWCWCQPFYFLAYLLLPTPPTYPPPMRKRLKIADVPTRAFCLRDPSLYPPNGFRLSFSPSSRQSRHDRKNTPSVCCLLQPSTVLASIVASVPVVFFLVQSHPNWILKYGVFFVVLSIDERRV